MFKDSKNTGKLGIFPSGNHGKTRYFPSGNQTRFVRKSNALYSVSPAQLADRHGLRILVTLGAALEAVRTAKSPWTSSLFKTFAAFEDAYGSRFTSTPVSDDRPGFELTLDLCEPDAARLTFYAHSLIRRHDEATSHVRIELAPSGPSSRLPPLLHQQASLWESVLQ